MVIGDNLPSPVKPLVEQATTTMLGVALNRIEQKIDSVLRDLQSIMFAGNLKEPSSPTPPVPTSPAASQTPKTSFYYKAGDGSFTNVNIDPNRPACPLCGGAVKFGKGRYGAYYHCAIDKIYFNESKKR